MAKKSEFLSAFGTAFEIWKAITDAVLERGGSDDDIRRILTSEDLLATIANAIVEEGKKPAGTFYFTVNYDLSVEDMVRAGKYDYAAPAITSDHFRITRRGKSEIEAKIVPFDRLSELEKQGYRPADIAELLAFGASFPRPQQKDTIIALDSVWIMDSDYSDPGWVAYLAGNHEGLRTVGLCRLLGDWSKYWSQFLAVRVRS